MARRRVRPIIRRDVRHPYGGAQQGLQDRILATAALPRPRPPEPRNRARRDLRVPRAERRRQDHDSQTSDAADLSHVGARRDSRAPGGRRQRETSHRLPARRPVLLRLPDCRRTSLVLREPARLSAIGPIGPGFVAARQGRHWRRTAPAASEVLEGHAPAGRHRSGGAERSRGCVPR
jgi:hypothetical protein